MYLQYIYIYKWTNNGWYYWIRESSSSLAFSAFFPLSLRLLSAFSPPSLCLMRRVNISPFILRKRLTLFYVKRILIKFVYENMFFVNYCQNVGYSNYSECWRRIDRGNPWLWKNFSFPKKEVVHNFIVFRNKKSESFLSQGSLCILTSLCMEESEFSIVSRKE